MTMSIEGFRRAREKRGRGRYPKSARRWAVGYARRGLSKGLSLSAIAAELGVSDMTLRVWLSPDPAQTPAGELCEVVVAEHEPTPSAVRRPVTLTTAQGHVVTGLDLEGAAALLRALA